MHKFKLIILLVLFTSCHTEKQLEKLYKNQRPQLEYLKNYYEGLCNKQSICLGFTDEKFEYYFYEIETDTGRFVYNNLYGVDAFDKKAADYGIARWELDTLAAMMQRIGCIWIDQVPFYTDDFKKIESVYMSFKMRKVRVPGTERKYVAIGFFDDIPFNSLTKKQKRRLKIKLIDDQVYYLISNRFR